MSPSGVKEVSASSRSPLDERLKEHAAARVEAARAELREAIEAQQAVAGVNAPDGGKHG